ncbi:MAG: AAA family ATPase [Henriciella sp.]
MNREIKALKALDAAARKAELEPAYVLLKSERGACQKRWQERRPSLNECVAWIGRGNHVGIQPGSMGAVVFDSDGGSGPEAIADWAAQRDALICLTPSTSGNPKKGHAWCRVEDYSNAEGEATHIKNGKWACSAPFDESEGEIRGWSAQVRLTFKSMEMLTKALVSNRFSEGEMLLAEDVRSLYSSKAQTADREFCSSEGVELTGANLPADVADRLMDPERAARFEELFAIAGRLKGERFSFDTVLDVIAPYVRAWPPQDGKFDGAEMHRHLAEAWRKLPAVSDPADDFEDDLEDLVEISAPERKSKPRFLDYFDLSEMKDPEWLVEGMIPVGSLGSILGESQTYKTFFALRIGLALAVGADPFEGHGPNERLPTQLFFIAGEGAETLKHRVTAALEDLNVSPSKDGSDGNWEGSPPICFQPMPTAINDPKEFEKLQKAIAAARLPDHRVLLIVDTLSQNFSGDENSTSDMRGFVRNLDQLKRSLRAPVGDGKEEDATVVFIHHLGKDRSKGARGSSLLLADVDFQITLSRAKNALASEVTVTKQKAAAIGPVGILQMRQTAGMGMDATLVCEPMLVPNRPDPGPALDRQAWIVEVYQPGIRRTELINQMADEFGISPSTAGRAVSKFLRDYRELSVETGPNNSKIIKGELLLEELE